MNKKILLSHFNIRNNIGTDPDAPVFLFDDIQHVLFEFVATNQDTHWAPEKGAQTIHIKQIAKQENGCCLRIEHEEKDAPASHILLRRGGDKLFPVPFVLIESIMDLSLEEAERYFNYLFRQDFAKRRYQTDTEVQVYWTNFIFAEYRWLTTRSALSQGYVSYRDFNWE